MKKWRRLMATSLVGCLLNVTVADLAMAQTPAGSIVIKQQVNQLGVGANVKLKLTAGEKLQGFIEQIDEEAFLFFASEQESSPRRVAYDQVAELRLANLTYKASTQPILLWPGEW